ncbi:MAG: superoxide dismutase [Fe] [Nitrococcus sp.]|nr:superoxide dismutase [Fe] [Nitrococcus sp.]
MKIELPELPYAINALEPYISQETLEYHHGKHHKAYVDKTNQLIEGTEYANMELEAIIKKASGGLFNQTAQVWNHTFYWNSMAPNAGGDPNGPVADAIRESFGSFDDFRKQFNEKTAGNFGSGWGWLVKNKSDNKLAILETDDAQTALTNESVMPLMTCDVWEHAYYIDYRNARPKYLEAFWNLVNWKFVNQNFEN